MATPIVKDAKTAEEAAQLLNQHFFNKVNVHYNTGRKRANQSPKESMAIGKASCTGLSIILVNACRAVGIPARAAGIPLWPDKRGNHTWVEIHDGKQWRFTGADEYDAKGLDRGWFKKKAGEAQKDHPLHSIYATSWKPEGTHFPVPWNPRGKTIGAVNVSERYIIESDSPATLGQTSARHSSLCQCRPWLTHHRRRSLESHRRLHHHFLRHQGRHLRPQRHAASAGSAGQELPPGLRSRWPNPASAEFVAKAGISTMDVQLKDLKPIAVKGAVKGLTKEETAKAGFAIYKELLAKTKNARATEMEKKSITIGDKEMKWLEKTFGDAPCRQAQPVDFHAWRWRRSRANE